LYDIWDKNYEVEVEIIEKARELEDRGEFHEAIDLLEDYIEKIKVKRSGHTGFYQGYT